VSAGSASLLCSVLMLTGESDPRWLRRAIEWVRAPTDGRGEPGIADDASTRAEVQALRQAAAAQDPRIRLMLRPSRGHISALSNSAPELGREPFVALLNLDDKLAPGARAA
jgi:hypothetical protein